MSNFNEQRTLTADQKLELEVENLRYQNSLRARILSALLPSAVSLTTAIVAVIGIVVSIATFKQQVAHTIADDQEKRFQQALSMATDPTGPERRISGIYQLGQFWTMEKATETIAPLLPALVLPKMFRKTESLALAALPASTRRTLERALHGA